MMELSKILLFSETECRTGDERSGEGYQSHTSKRLVKEAATEAAFVVLQREQGQQDSI